MQEAKSPTLAQRTLRSVLKFDPLQYINLYPAKLLSAILSCSRRTLGLWTDQNARLNQPNRLITEEVWRLNFLITMNHFQYSQPKYTCPGLRIYTFESDYFHLHVLTELDHLKPFS